MKSNQKRFDIIISIVGAVILWIYVINIVNPPTTATFRNIPVTITGEESLISSGRALVHSGDYYTNIDVSGARNDIKNLTEKDIKLTADVSNLAQGVSSVAITASLPSGIKVENIENSTVNLTIEDYVTVDKPVEIVFSGAEEGQEATILSTSLSQIGVSGAQSVVASVAAVRVTGNLANMGLDVSKEHTLAASAVDSSGKAVSGVKLAQDTVSVSAVLYQTKTVPLSVPVTGDIWEGAVLSETRVPDSVIIKGPAAQLSRISEISAEEISIDGLYETAMEVVDPILPDGVYLADSMDTLHAEFIIADEGRLTYTYRAAAINIKNLSEGTTASFTLPESSKEITAAITGPVATLRTLAPGDVAPTADAANRPAGDYSVTLSPSRSITGLTVIFNPTVVSMRIK